MALVYYNESELTNGRKIMPVITKWAKCEFNPDAKEIAEIFWEMDDEEQCYFFEHLSKISGGKLAMQLEFVRDSKFFTNDAKKAMQLIGDYAKWK